MCLQNIFSGNILTSDQSFNSEHFRAGLHEVKQGQIITKNTFVSKVEVLEGLELPCCPELRLGKFVHTS